MENKLNEFIKEVQEVFSNIDKDILTDYFNWGWTANEFIHHESELRYEDEQMK